MAAFALAGARIALPGGIATGQAVIVEAGRIREIVAAASLPAGIARRDVTGLLAPGFIDIQVNGGGGVLLNDRPTVDGIRAIGAAHRRFGTTGFLPTLITDTRETMAAAIAAVREGLAAGVPGLLGIHLEGPFLNPARKGVHDPKLMRPVEAKDIRLMSSLGAGRTLVTLAPEMVPMEAISELAAAGVIVAAGHSAASPEVLAEARRRGLRGYTHLFNAMPPFAGREPGPVGAALADADAYASLIVDLHHVSATAIRAALAAKPDRLMLITDAMAATGTELTGFELQGRKIYRREGRLTTADGTLAGSDLDMASAVRNAVREVGAPLQHALGMASAVPAAFLGLSAITGSIAPGLRADLVLLGDDFCARTAWLAGEQLETT